MADLHTNMTDGAQITFKWPHPIGDLKKVAEAIGMGLDEFIRTTIEISVTAMPEWEDYVSDPTQYNSAIADEANDIIRRHEVDNEMNGGNR